MQCNCCNELVLAAKQLVSSGYVFVCSTAIQKHSKPGDWPISMQIRGPLACFESSMDRAGLSHTNRRWMQACLLTTYMLLRTCHDWKRDYAAVFQVTLFLNIIRPITTYNCLVVFNLREACTCGLT